MKKLTKEQKTILTTNLEKVNERIIKETLFIDGNRVIFSTVNKCGLIKEYIVNFESKLCLSQLLSSVSINESHNAEWFKF